MAGINRTTGKATDLITFSRASGGTALRKISYGSELVTSGGFEIDTSGWSVTIGTGTITASGGYGVVSRDAAASGYVSATYSFPTVVGKLYSASGSLVATDGTAVVIGKSDSPTNLNANRVNIYGGSSGTTVLGGGQETFVATATTTYIHLFLVSVTGPSVITCSFDNISVKEVLFDQPDGTLTLFNHPDNIPRIEYAADGTVKGLLIEEQRTNLLTYSNEFNNSAWLKSVVVTEDQDAGPDGSVTADYVTGASSGRLYTIISGITPGSTYTASVWVKNVDLTLNFYLDVLDVPNGLASIAQQDFLSSLSTDAYTRVSLTFTAPTGCTSVRLYVGCTGSSSGWTVGESAYLYGAQFEAGSFPTSYIATSGATATRSADIASISVDNFGYRQDAGTVVVDWEPKNLNYTNTLFELGSGTTSDQIFGLSHTGRHLYGKVGGAVQFDLTAGSPNLNSPNKLGGGYKLNNVAVVLNGGSAASDASASIPSNIDTFHIGKNYSASAIINGHIKSISYYPRRLSNAQLQELTA